MKTLSRVTVTTIFILLLTAGDDAIAQSQSECTAVIQLGFPRVNATFLPPDSKKVEVSADAIQQFGDQMTLKGNVLLRFPGTILTADQVVHKVGENIYHATKGVHVYMAKLDVQSDALVFNGNTNDFMAEAGRYQLYAVDGDTTQGRQLLAYGSAQIIERKGRKLMVTETRFSNCTEAHFDVQLLATELELDFETYQGKARSTSVSLNDHKVFAFPFFQFPVGEHRQSGFLFPTVGLSDKHGAKAGIPYYFSLAPNYDAILNFKPYSKRGIQLGTEFRHLGLNSETQFQGNFLPKDQHKDRRDFDARYDGHLESKWHDKTRFYSSVDLRWVSDEHYLNDFAGINSASSSGYLRQEASMSAVSKNYSATVGGDKLVIAKPGISKANRTWNRYPWARFRGQFPVGYGLSLGLDAAYDDFRHDVTLAGKRTHTDAHLRFRSQRAAGILEVTTGTEKLGYRLSNTDAGEARNRGVSNSYFTVDGRLFFDSEPNASGNWTIEPRIQFAGAKRIRQDNLPLFDTRPVKFENYEDLFRSSSYVGRDRIRDTDRVSVGVSLYHNNATRPNFVKRVGIGRVFYDRKKLPSLTLVESDSPRRKSDIFVGAQVGNSVHSGRLGLLYNDEVFDKIMQVFGKYTRKINENSKVETIYRFLRDDDEQAGFGFTTKPHKDWEIGYLHVESLERKRSMESRIRFDYSSCCWSAGIQIAQEKETTKKRDNSVSLYFRIDGFGRIR